VKTEQTVEKRAVEIAAVIMVRAGLCRYSTFDKCRKASFVSERDCARCIKRWLLGKAKKELTREKEDKPT
jgi:hypothetical protein